MKNKLPFSKQIAFAIGQLGWSINMGLVNSYLVYFYSPPEGEGLTYRIPQIAILGVFTVIGLITMAGRLMDAVTDPLVASLSDRHKSPKGRRIPFLAKSAIPLSILTLMLFFNPVDGISAFNVIWLAVILLTFYIVYTLYVTPYMALIPELGKTPDERLNIATQISVTFFIGTALASQAPLIWNAFESLGMEKIFAIRLTIGILVSMSAIFMLVPVFAIEEKKYCEATPSEIPLLKSLKSAFNDREFLVFAISDLSYFLSLTMLQTGLMYYVTVLLELGEAFYSQLFIIMMVGSFAFYPFVNLIAKKIGKKKVLSLGFIVFVLNFALVFFLGKEIIPLSGIMQGYIIAGIAAFPLAAFGILQNAILSDIAEYDAVINHNRKEGIYFGARTFMSKMGQMLSMLIFTWLLTFGKDTGNDLGIRLTGPVSAFFCFLGLVFFLMYNEKKILSIYKK